LAGNWTDFVESLNGCLSAPDSIVGSAWSKSAVKVALAPLQQLQVVLVFGPNEFGYVNSLFQVDLVKSLLKDLG
jgi:hypothetical protein